MNPSSNLPIVKIHPAEKFIALYGRGLGKSAWWLLVLAPLCLLIAGCHRDDVKVYRVAKDSDQSQSQTAPALPTDSPNPSLPPGHPDISSAPGTAVPATPRAGLPQLTWQTPNGWTEQPPGEMRVASFRLAGRDGKQADVSVIPLPGLAGSDDANVNRWRGQVGLPSMSPDELKKSAEDIEAGGQSAQLYDIGGKNPGSGDPERILGVIQHRDDMAWFYKMTGEAGLVEQQKPAFVAFLKSLKFAAAAAQTELPPSHPPVSDMGMGAVPAATAPVSNEGKPGWQVPAGWQEVSGGQFLVAKFVLNGPAGTAAVNVSSSPSKENDLAANVNRWRVQLGFAPLSDDEVSKSVTAIDVAGGKASLVDLSGKDARTGQPTRLVGVVVPQSGQTWFYKLMGNAQVVETQKAAFTQFVQGVKY